MWAYLIAYLAGLILIATVNSVNMARGATSAWRFVFNFFVYNAIFGLLAYIVYRMTLRSWLKGHVSGRVLTISEISSDAVYSLDPDGTITSWSKGAERILGYDEEEAVGQSVSMILPEGFLERELDMLKTLEEDGIITRHQTRRVRKGGEEFPAEASMTLLKRPGGSVGGMLVVLRDMTKQVRIEEELERVHKESESLVKEGTSGGVGAQEEFERMKSSASATVRALAAVAERRDPYTANHQRRVSHLARAIAVEMGLPEQQVEGIRIAGILHDTGKVAVPSEILSKPGKLSEFEFGIVKAHPKADFGIIEGVEFPWPVADTVLQHHERIDGSGYPSGLKGDNILLEARILAVADVVEAMASHRPYRPARGIDAALEEIRSGKGRLYDPEAADACCRLFEEKHYELV